MLGQAISMLLPRVVGYKITGQLNQYATSTDLVLTITKVIMSLETKYFVYGTEEISSKSLCLVKTFYFHFNLAVGMLSKKLGLAWVLEHWDHRLKSHKAWMYVCVTVLCCPV